MRLTRTVAASALPVERDAAKAHCRVLHADEDTLIDGLMAAATEYLDGPSGILGRAIVTQTWLLELEAWPGQLVLPVEPVQSVAVKYDGSDDAEHVLASEAYELIERPSRPTLLDWTAGVTRPQLGTSRFPVRIEITAGFGDAAEVPQAIKVAIMMLVTHWYETRSPVVMGDAPAEVPKAVDTLLARWRVMV